MVLSMDINESNKNVMGLAGFGKYKYGLVGNMLSQIKDTQVL